MSETPDSHPPSSTRLDSGTTDDVPNSVTLFKWSTLGHIASVVSTLGFLATVAAFLGDKPPIMFLVIITPIFYIVSYVTVSMFQDVLAPARDRTIGKVEMERWAKFLLRLVMLAFGALVISSVLSMITGWPLEMRNYLNPAIVRRESWPNKAIELNSFQPVTLKKREPLVQLSGQGDDRQKRQLIWEEWLYEGATKNGETIAVYKSPQYKSYYKEVSGKVIFSGATENAKLADCIGFVTGIDPKTGLQSLRQIDLAPGLKNMDAPAGQGLENEFKKLTIDPGDCIVLIVQFAGLTDAEIKTGLSAKLLLDNGYAHE